ARWVFIQPPKGRWEMRSVILPLCTTAVKSRRAGLQVRVRPVLCPRNAPPHDETDHATDHASDPVAAVACWRRRYRRRAGHRLSAVARGPEQEVPDVPGRAGQGVLEIPRAAVA